MDHVRRPCDAGDPGPHPETPVKKSEASPARLYATLVGGALVVAGILGFFYSSSFETGRPVGRESDEVLGILAVNGWHNLVHIATGLVGLAAAAYVARTFALAAGLAYLLLAIWGFIVVEDGFGVILDIIPMNTEDNFLHLILGLTGLAAGAATPPIGANRRPGRQARGSRRREGRSASSGA